MPLETTRFDIADHLKTPEDRTIYLQVAMEDGDPSHIADALGHIARAQGMTAVAREAGVTREALYKALSAGGDPKLSTLLGVTKALGVRLTVASIAAGRPRPRKVSRRRPA